MVQFELVLVKLLRSAIKPLHHRSKQVPFFFRNNNTKKTTKIQLCTFFIVLKKEVTAFDGFASAVKFVNLKQRMSLENC